MSQEWPQQFRFSQARLFYGCSNLMLRECISLGEPLFRRRRVLRERTNRD